jgi:hypothetical protein
MRSEFEKWIKQRCVPNLTIVDGEYMSPTMQLAWESWQASRLSKADLYERVQQPELAVVE